MRTTKLFPEAVIDPATGRMVGIAIDLARWLNCHPSTIARLASYGQITRRCERYFDAEETRIALEKSKVGRPSRSIGMSNIVFAQIAEATKSGDKVLYIDPEEAR